MAAAIGPSDFPRSISPPAIRIKQPATAANALSRLAESDNDSDKDDALVQRTTGRLLSRLQQVRAESLSEEEYGDSDEDTYERTKRRLAAARSATVSSGEEEEDNGQDAYERMKQRLMASTGMEKRLRLESVTNVQKPAAAASSSEDEDDAPVRANRTRKPQERREKTGSPTRSPTPRTRSREPSLGLFVTPESTPAKNPTHNVNGSDDASEQSTPGRGANFRRRVERIRAERLAKTSEKKQRRTTTARQGDHPDTGSNSDGEDSRRLTQLAKPTRKAGKKALEAMARDQQRIVRNMQLTHQAKTKKRYGTKDLFAKFGFNQGLDDLESTSLPTPDNSSLPATSDIEAVQARDTPPTSPPVRKDAPGKGGAIADQEHPELADTQPRPSSPSLENMHKGKSHAPEYQNLPPNQTMKLSQPFAIQRTHVEPSKSISETMVDLDDSDDDLDIVKPKSRFPVFDNLPTKKERESSSLLHLRHLAQLTSPSKKGLKGKKTMNMVQLQGSLFQKARQQAQKERQEKIEMLRAKGIVIETEEEKEKRQMEIEDLVAQFEKEKEKDLKLARRERELAKKNGEIADGLESSDEEDEDYVASGDEIDAVEVSHDVDDIELDLSGSEDEEADDEEDFDNSEDEDQEAVPASNLVDTMSNEDGQEEGQQAAQDQADHDVSESEPTASRKKASTKRIRKVIVDEEDEDEQNTSQLHGSPTQVATQDDTMAAFGFGNAASTMGLTQAFAGTMANLETDSQTEPSLPADVEQDSIDFLRSLPDSQPNFSQTNDFVVPNSQAAASQQESPWEGSGPQLNLGISQLMEETTIFSQTQASEVPEPTQDAGFLLSRSPAGLVLPQSTVDTVMLPVPESPIAQRKGKLSRRRKEVPVVLSDVDDENVFSASDTEAGGGPAATEDAFSFLKKAAKRKSEIDTFNKKTSAAREHLDEQAYESDDEYKGLGGASDEDSGEEDADLVDMIDTSDVKVDERKIAALFADKTRKEHDASVAKIYKDLQTGAFRKRGVGDAFDMSDSEDELEMRRRKKQREFDQMFRALKNDEVIGKMAENPKRKAFFATIMDHSDDSDLEFLDHPEEPAAKSASQSDEEKPEKQAMQDVSIPDSQNTETLTNPLKRKSPAPEFQEKENRPPPHLRRTAAADAMTRRPISAADIKDSVAELLDDPRDVVPDSQYISLSESEDESSTTILRQERVVTNRLSRTPSLATESTTTSNLAFQAPSVASVGSFRVPSLIRRATSNLSAASERSTTSSIGKSSEGVRRGGTGRSNIHAQAREAERRAVLEKAEGRRKEALKKKVGMARGKRSVLSRLGGGFE